tara:strand:- start:57 stop:302 length:246 start_codon:yes stop_codon:yes gene_type:complete
MTTITHNGKEYTFGDVEENGVTRVLTDAEAIEFAEASEAQVIRDAEIQAIIDQKDAEVASAKTKLEGLGLTVNEVKSAFGI